VGYLSHFILQIRKAIIIIKTPGGQRLLVSLVLRHGCYMEERSYHPGSNEIINDNDKLPQALSDYGIASHTDFKLPVIKS